MKKILTLIAALSLVVSLAVGGSIAWLSDTDQAVNTMTLGNVYIDQHEYERVVDENGNLVEGVEGKDFNSDYGINQSYKLQEFTNGKPAFPAVYTNAAGTEAWDEFQQLWNQVGAPGSNDLFDDSMKNVIDKFVFVENTGKSEAYYRTIIAIEVPDGISDDLIHVNLNANSRFDYDTNTDGVQNPGDSNKFFTTIKGSRYLVYTATHTEALKPGEVSRPSLLQLYLDPMATNEDCAKFGDAWDVLVVSQAVQTAGFADAQTALNTAFGPISEKSHPWMDWDGKTDDEGDQDPDLTFVSTPAELVAAFAEGGDIKLTDDIKLDKITSIEPGTEVYLDLNGNTITVDQNSASNTLFYVKDGAKLIIDGNGTIDLKDLSTMAIFAPYGELVIENGTFIRNEVTTVTNKTTGLFMGAKSVASNVTINGGYFDSGYYDTNAAEIEEILAGNKEFTETADDIAKRGISTDANPVRVAVKDNVTALLNHSGYGSFKVYGGTFVGANPAWGDEGCMLPTTPNYLRPWSYYQGALLEGQTFNENGLVIPEGYTITNSKNADGVPVYTVKYNK